jgi:hypothetical protein
MTLNSAYVSDFVPHDNPCAQCGKPIAKPIWSEPGAGCVSYVWSCRACDYEFTCTAVYAHHEQRSLAA